MYLCKKILFPAAAGVSLLCTLLYCSHFDSTTDLGKDIISRDDSSMVNFDNNFLTFSGDSSLIIGATSIPGESEKTRFGVHEYTLSVGSLGNEHASGFIEFQIDSDDVKKITKNDSLHKDTLQNIIFVVDTLPTDTALHAKKKPKLKLFSSSEGSRYTCDTSGQAYDSLMVADTAKKKSYFDTLSSSALSPTASNIFEACTSSATRKNPKLFQFSLTNSDSLITRFGLPHLIITFKRDTSVIHDTIPASYTNYVVTEDKSSVSTLSQQPISSFASRRTAQFKINLNPVWDTLAKRANFNRILSAMLTIKCGMNWSEIKDSTIYYNFFFSQKPITDGVTLDSTLKASGRQGQFIFKSPIVVKDTTTVNDSIIIKDKIINSLTFKDSTAVLSIENFIRPLVSTKPPYGFLYINLTRPSGSDAWQKVIWKKPNLKLVATASKR